MLFGASSAAPAQAVVAGRVADAKTAQPIATATVVIEGTPLLARSDSAGEFRIAGVRPGPHVVRTSRLGYAISRQPVEVPATGTLTIRIELARNALELSQITVTADPSSRARGELGTASVIESDAIRNQMATSLAGVLELLPGVELSAPSLGGTQQFALRAVPISGGGVSAIASPSAASPSAQQLASFGTQLVLDGVPVSNNANLQSLGSRAELSLPTAAGGGVDLRRIPAATIERVEVIRGIPSARFGDLTQGVVIVDTRAGAFDPTFLARFDAKTSELSLASGRALGSRQALSITSDLARTLDNPGVSDDRTYRVTGGLAYRLALGRSGVRQGADTARFALDSRIDFYKVFEDNPPEEPTPDVASFSHDAGLRVLERIHAQLSDKTALSITASMEGVAQRSFTQGPRLRAAMPFTNSLAAGRSIGSYIGGTYGASVSVSGDPRQIYTRTELTHQRALFGADHELRGGVELRREWTGGAGYQFDMEFPPQSDFNGVQGFARPRRYDAVPPVATSAFYIDDWMRRTLFGSASLQVQAGLRIDAFHRGTTWLSGVRDNVVQPRLNAELAPVHWLRLRVGAGRMAKLPAFADLYPAPQYNDVVNVNWYANNPAERLAILTTYIFDPTNPGLRYSYADRGEAGLELELGRPDAQLSIVTYADRLHRGVGIAAEPTFLLRDHYQLSDSSSGTGVPPQIIEPPSSRDTVPVIVDRRANNLTMASSGTEATVTLPEIPRLRTRLALGGSIVRSRLTQSGIELPGGFSDFQLDETRPRYPYWTGTVRTGELALLTTRIIHHQPKLGLVITATVQHTLRELRRDIGGSDTLSWTGYVTRAGVLVPVPASERADPQYQDLRLSRTGLLSEGQRGPVDWILNLQISKSMPGDGRLSFYAFNALDKVGSYGNATVAAHLYAPTQFGLELSMPMPFLVHNNR
ncbi:MAG TPA: TonB-dependent receptor [Gemmatimonadaceae bacterium]